MTLPAEKARLRAQIRRRRREFDPAARDRANRAIDFRLESLPILQRAHCVQTYVSLPQEVDTHALIRRLLRAATETFDLVLVPGLAFDRTGNRLGAGKGYYDRFLAGMKAPKIALAFAFQIVEPVPTAPHDQRVDMIVTEDEVITCR